jgi:hypothetical protein
VSEDSRDPLFHIVTSSDKGYEDMRIIQGNKFRTIYGSDISFSKHGQPLLQIANIIDNGGKVLIKRLVAENATLANVYVTAEVTLINAQKVDDNDDPLYDDGQGGETTDPSGGGDPIMVHSATEIRYCAKTKNGAKTKEEVFSAAAAAGETVVTTDTGKILIFPLFALVDTGRGVSNKRFRIVPDYPNSRNSEFAVYQIQIIENGKVLENMSFSTNPNAVSAQTNISLQNVLASYSNQLIGRIFEDDYANFIDKLYEFTDLTPDNIDSVDLLFGKNNRGVVSTLFDVKFDVDNIYTHNGMDLSYEFGISLGSGTNGSFGDRPFGTDAWTQEAVNFFTGKITTDIYDRDTYKIDIIPDANYPIEVKRAIEELAVQREDAVYMRDMGASAAYTIEDIKSINVANKKHFTCVTYVPSYEIVDPYTKKHIRVTILYDLCKLLIGHYSAGATRPLAGLKYSVTIPNAIEGTLNFKPVRTPEIDQFLILEEERVNYAIYREGVLTVETLWTSQEKYTQLSFMNNVVAVQRVIKALRTKFPKIRYAFITGDDLDSYSSDVNAELRKYSSDFAYLRMTYVQDPVAIANKIYYAVVEFQMRDFVQRERMEFYVLKSGETPTI